MKTWREVVFGGSLVIGCPTLVAIFAGPACSCMPPDYRELDLTKLAPDILAEASEASPGFRPGRVWEYGYGLESHRGRVEGYLLRGQSPGGWWTKDLKIPAPGVAGVGDPIELEPIP